MTSAVNWWRKGTEICDVSKTMQKGFILFHRRSVLGVFASITMHICSTKSCQEKFFGFRKSFGVNKALSSLLGSPRCSSPAHTLVAFAEKALHMSLFFPRQPFAVSAIVVPRRFHSCPSLPPPPRICGACPRSLRTLALACLRRLLAESSPTFQSLFSAPCFFAGPSV